MTKILYVFLWLMIYSFIGWAYESTLCSITEKKLINRGFLNGPICPVYGFGSLIIIFVLGDVANTPIALFLSSMVLTGILEYLTSYLLERFFHARWWDYSQYPFNINGRICLFGGIIFGLLSVLLLTYLHPFILSLLGHFKELTLIVTAIVLLLILVLDIGITVSHLCKLNHRLEEIQTALNLYKKQSKKKMGHLKNSLQQKFENSEFYSSHIQHLLEVRKFQDKRLFGAFPHMKSIKYGDALEHMKKQLTSNIHRNKK